MKDISVHSSSDSLQLQLHSSDPAQYGEDTDAFQLPECLSEPEEPFKLSLLASPVGTNKRKKSLKEFSALSSPYTASLDQKQQQTISDKKSTNLDLFLDALLRKREGCAPETPALAEHALNFTKQLHRVKYYWRGTSLNYPFTFMRLSAGEGESLGLVDDYAGKRVNANDTLIN